MRPRPSVNRSMMTDDPSAPTLEVPHCIRCFAVRDPPGKFLGTMEVTQNATALRKLQGERWLLDEVKPDKQMP